MKKILVTATILLTALTTNAQDKKKEDIQAIKSMCGCYEVTFNFAETFHYSKDTLNYKPSKDKIDYGLEWVQLVDDEPNKISMQHLLIVGKTEDAIVKHWRQDWLYENTDLYLYDKGETWKYKKLTNEEAKGKWTQKVYQVDDSPRYEGAATWVHVDGRHFWENNTDAPLPRREHTVRNDYNVLNRNNLHEITKNGWIHDQDNQKIMRADKDVLLAKEKGHDVYTKVDDAKCALAQNYWKKNAQLWKKVRTKWATIFDRKKELNLNKTVDKQPLFMKLFALKSDASNDEVNTIIDSYISK